MADEQFTEEDVELVGRWFKRFFGASHVRRSDREYATEILRALAEAGRLLPAGVNLHAQGVEYASEHAGHAVEGLVDPFIQPVGSSRSLAAIRVEVWQKTHPGTHRVVSRELITYVTPWVPVGYYNGGAPR